MLVPPNFLMSPTMSVIKFFQSTVFTQYYLYHKTKLKTKRVLFYKSILLDGPADHNERVRELKKAFKQNSLGLFKVHDAFWLLLIQQLTQNDQSEYLQEKLNELPAKYFKVTDWIELSSLFITLGFFQCALVAREKGVEKAYQLSSNKLSFFFNSDAITGATIDRFDKNTLIKALQYSSIRRTHVGTSPVRNFLNYYTGASQNKKFDSPEFYNLIKGKNVAVVGPLTLTHKAIEEINSFDLIIKVNVIDINKAIKDEPGLNWDKVIVYITPRLLNKLIKENGIDKVEKPIAYITRILSPLKQYKGKYVNSHGVLFRSMYNLNFFTFNGGLNFLPRVILDTYYHEAENIKVFGADLYSSLNYASDYQTNSALNKHERYSEIFIGHDIITQYKVISQLYYHDVFTADERLDDVMKLGLNGYLKLMEKNFQPHFINMQTI